MNSVLKSLQASVLASADDPEEESESEGEDDHDQFDETGSTQLKPRHPRKSSLAIAVKTIDQTPMMSVLNILSSLRGSLPAGKRWMLDKIIRQLTHAKEGDLYTPYSISKQGHPAT